MLMNIDNLVDKYDIQIKGVIHIGAHTGEEYDGYKKLGIQKMIFFEPMKKTFNILSENVDDTNDIILANVALGKEEKEVEMYVASNDQSSSILKSKLHLTQHPTISFNEKEKVHQTTLDIFFKSHGIKKEDYNFINIDVQGYELEVFKGAVSVLDSIEYVYAEVNRDEVYENCVKIEKLDAFLSVWDMTRVETDWAGDTWGDALFIRK